MSFTFVPPIDYTGLATALLPLVKAHCRVRHTDDDTILTEYTRQALDMAQKVWDFRVFPVKVAWIPEPAGYLSRYACPVWPVSAATVTVGIADVSSDYQIEMTSMVEPWWLARKDGKNFPVDAAVELTTGFADATSIPPAGMSAILRIAATLYEDRERASGGPDDLVPAWMNDLLVGLWVPRV